MTAMFAHKHPKCNLTRSLLCDGLRYPQGTALIPLWKVHRMVRDYQQMLSWLLFMPIHSSPYKSWSLRVCFLFLLLSSQKSKGHMCITKGPCWTSEERKDAPVIRALAWDLGDLGSNPCSATDYLQNLRQVIQPLFVPQFLLRKMGTTALTHLAGVEWR